MHRTGAFHENEQPVYIHQSQTAQKINVTKMISLGSLSLSFCAPLFIKAVIIKSHCDQSFPAEIKPAPWMDRSCSDGLLFCCEETLLCMAAGCVQCAYKLVVQPTLPCTSGDSHVSFKPNGRPEECLRARRFRSKQTSSKARHAHAISSETVDTKSSGTRHRRLGLYTSEARILTVGDGDLSFSLSLAQGLHVPKVSLRWPEFLTCTCVCE